jgi:hypothetical protein
MNQKRTITQLLETLMGQVATSPKIKEFRRPGRPKDEARHVAMLAHFYMVRSEISGIKGIKDKRRSAATTLKIGNQKSPENQERQAREQIAKAEKALLGEGQIITFSGDDLGEGRCWLAVEDLHDGVHSRVENYAKNLVVIDGWGWLCEWGEQRARYGHITSRVIGSEGGEKLTGIFLSLPNNE